MIKPTNKLNLNSSSKKQLIIVVLILTFIFGFMPAIPEDLFSKISGPNYQNWSNRFWDLTHGQLLIWPFLSEPNATGFPFSSASMRSFGVECEAGGCGSNPVILFPGLIANFLFYLVLLKVFVKTKSIPLIAGLLVVPVVLTMVLGYIPFPNRCPYFEDRLQYISVDPETGTAEFLNLEDRRKYLCALDETIGNNNDHCRLSLNVGSINRITALGFLADVTSINDCKGSFGGLSLDECGYSCKIIL